MRKSASDIAREEMDRKFVDGIVDMLNEFSATQRSKLHLLHQHSDAGGFGRYIICEYLLCKIEKMIEQGGDGDAR